MNPPSSESGGSGPDPRDPRPSPFLHRKGILSQGEGVWAEAVCADVLGAALRLSLLPNRGAGELRHGAPASFRLVDGGGLLVANGLLEEPETVQTQGVAGNTLALAVRPGGVERLNRREFYRVSLHLRGKVLFCPDSGLPRALGRSGPVGVDALAAALNAQAQPCTLKDLSLGGARIAVACPAPRPGSDALLETLLGPGEVLGPLPAVVVQARAGPRADPARVVVRLRFQRLPSAVEGRLNRYLTQAQREQLKAGIRG